VLAVGVGIGCSGQTSDPEAMTLEAFARAAAQDYCARVNGCCEAYVGPFDRAACVSEEQDLERLEALFALPGAQFDGRAAAKCLQDAKADPTCDLHAVSNRCKYAFVGELAPGAEC